MKKIILYSLSIFFIILNVCFGQDPCAICQTPYQCQTLTFRVDGCNFDIIAIICYYCDPTNNRIYMRLSHLSSVCVGYEQAAWDYVSDWIDANRHTFCGQKPCDQPPPIEVHVTSLVCANVQWNGTTLTIWGSANCNYVCTNVYEWCYCNCTPDCDDDPECPYPHNKLCLKSQSYTGDECDEIVYGTDTNFPTGPNDRWTNCTSWNVSGCIDVSGIPSCP